MEQCAGYTEEAKMETKVLGVRIICLWTAFCQLSQKCCIAFDIDVVLCLKKNFRTSRLETTTKPLKQHTG